MLCHGLSGAACLTSSPYHGVKASIHGFHCLVVILGKPELSRDDLTAHLFPSEENEGYAYAHTSQSFMATVTLLLLSFCRKRDMGGSGEVQGFFYPL